MSTLADLFAVRSRIARGLEAYLQAVADLEVPGWRFVRPKDRFPHEYVWPDVVPTADQRPGNRRKWFADPAAKNDDPMYWAPVRRILVRSRPGGGKTALSCMSASCLAATALEELRAGRTPLSDLALPLWLRVDDVVRSQSIEGALEKVLTNVLTYALSRHDGGGRTNPDVGAVVRYLVLARTRQQTTLFLDALDQRSSEMRADGLPWSESLRELSTLSCRVVVTSRPYSGVSRIFLDLVSRRGDDSAAMEYELEPLISKQKSDFVERRFQDDRDASFQVGMLLGRHESLNNLASNAVLLALICEHWRDLGPDAARVHLYDRAVREMLRGAVSELDLDKRIRVMAHAAAAMFEKPEPWFPEFSGARWDEMLQKACEHCGIHRADEFRAHLQADLERGGLVGQSEHDRLQFLHLTFFEYLAAVGLVDDSREMEVLTQHAR